jgi:hypothetical protein
VRPLVDLLAFAPISETGRAAKHHFGGKDGRGQLTASDREEPGHMGESTGEAAAYIASFAEQLARVAKTHGLATLAYLLHLARLEADRISKSSSGHAAPDGQD